LQEHVGLEDSDDHFDTLLMNTSATVEQWHMTFQDLRSQLQRGAEKPKSIQQVEKKKLKKPGTTLTSQKFVAA
jgi:ABC-type transporter Mla subunit MlaD